MATPRKFALRASNGLNPVAIDVDYAYQGRTKPSPAQRRRAQQRLVEAKAAVDRSLLAVAKGGGDAARIQLSRDIRVENRLRRKFSFD